ncbi:MAG: glycosyltransferase [Melioribacteraceae bacterium]|nr:glycosyltransferase [Melioribacteraceae bacterium]
MIKTSLIIAVYNNKKYLELVFAGLERQTFKDFEIIIADDGSNSKLIDFINKYRITSDFTIKHVWHEDKGFRKNKILNEAIRHSDAEHIVIIDGDCVPHREFMKEHYLSRIEGICFTGRRINLSEKFTSLLTPSNVSAGFIEKNLPRLFLDTVFGKSNYVEKGIYIKSYYLRVLLNTKKRGLLGCNFSLMKTDILDINGFDERYEAPSIGEDSDLQFRLELNGVRIESLNHITVQYHLYHKLQERPQTNLDLFEQVKKEKTAYTKYGIEKK